MLEISLALEVVRAAIDFKVAFRASDDFAGRLASDISTLMTMLREPRVMPIRQLIARFRFLVSVCA